MSDHAGGATVELDVMVAGEVPAPRAYIFRPRGGNRLTRVAAVLRPGAEMVPSPCLAFVVRHPSVGSILVDTGLHPDAGQSLRTDFGVRLSLLFRNLTPADRPFDEQLRGLGVEPADVRHVVMTHLHVDHTSGMRLLPGAEFVCSRDEWMAASRPSAVEKGYAAHHLPPAARMRLVDFGLDGEPHGPFAQTVDLLGDGSVRLISTPGHTRGHLSVLLRLPRGRRVLLIGDAAYTMRSVREEILPLLTVDDDVYLRSLRELKAFGELAPEAMLVPSHDPEAWRELDGGRALDVRASGVFSS